MEIPDDKLEQFGEPFFETKERSRGLFQVFRSQRIIEEHGGKDPGQGEFGEGACSTVLSMAASDA